MSGRPEVENDDVRFLSREAFHGIGGIGGLANDIALRGQPDAQKAADGCLVVHDQYLDRRRCHVGSFTVSVLRGNWKADGEDRPRAVGAVRRRDGAAHGLDEATADGEPEPGAGGDVVGLAHPVEAVEDAFEVIGRDAWSLVDEAQHHLVAVPPSLNCDCGGWRRILGGVVEKIEDHLLEKHGVDLQHRQVGRQRHLDPVPSEEARGPTKGAADDVAGEMQRGVRMHGARFQPRHVEQVADEPMQTFRLVDDRRNEFRPGRPPAARRHSP